jgi:hypothetical protein
VTGGTPRLLWGGEFNGVESGGVSKMAGKPSCSEPRLLWGDEFNGVEIERVLKMAGKPSLPKQVCS